MQRHEGSVHPLSQSVTSGEVLDQMRQMLLAVNRQGQIDNCPPELSDGYHRLLDDLAALDFYLSARQSTQQSQSSADASG